jgi:hypothetical protein
MKIELEFKYNPVPHIPNDDENAYWLLQYVVGYCNAHQRDMLMGKDRGWITCHHRSIRACIAEITANNKIKKGYRVWDDNRIYREENIYPTEELAIAECKRRNTIS